MGSSYLRKITCHSERSRAACTFFFGTLLSFSAVKAQPFVDIINTSFQSLKTTYQNDSVLKKNRTDNIYLNLTVPIKLDSFNTVIVRFYGEQLTSQVTEYDPSWYSNTSEGVVKSALLPIGFQHETKSHKWKFLALAMPKISGQFNPVSDKEFQMGGYGMATWVKNNHFKVKFGLFYNREFFGNFFIPVFGVDWVISPRLQIYGTLPNNFRLEYACVDKFLYAGLGFKSYTRSYHIYSESPLDTAHYYVRHNEMQVKAFVDLYIKKKFVLFGEFGRTIGYSPTLYFSGTKDKVPSPGVYSGLKDAFFFNVGLAYRIRFDFQ